MESAGLEESSRGGDDPVGALADLGGVAAGPVGDIAEAVGAGGETGRLAEDVGDAFGFDLGLATATGGVLGAGCMAVWASSWASVLAA